MDPDALAEIRRIEGQHLSNLDTYYNGNYFRNDLVKSVNLIAGTTGIANFSSSQMRNFQSLWGRGPHISEQFWDTPWGMPGINFRRRSRAYHDGGFNAPIHELNDLNDLLKNGF